MEFIDLIRQRRSIRIFDRRMPPRELIAECLEAAVCAPSATNQQPWEIIVLAGPQLAALNSLNEEHFFLRMQTADAFGEPPEPLKTRQQELLSDMVAAAQRAGIDPNEIFEKSLRFCDAPVGVYFLTRACPDHHYRLSTAAAVQNFLLAAHARGLAACWLSVMVVCAQEIKKHLAVPDDRELVAGVALGYPAAQSPVNTFKRTRAPVNEVTRWLGF